MDGYNRYIISSHIKHRCCELLSVSAGVIERFFMTWYAQKYDPFLSVVDDNDHLLVALTALRREIEFQSPTRELRLRCSPSEAKLRSYPRDQVTSLSLSDRELGRMGTSFPAKELMALINRQLHQPPLSDNTTLILTRKTARLMIGTRIFTIRGLEKLRQRHQGRNFDIDVKDLILRYLSMLDISTSNLHASLTPAVFRVLQQRLGVTTECFSSPFNANLTKYYSVFASDKAFGSLGNFFAAALPSGSYQLNPPFVEGVLTLLAERLLQYLTSEVVFTFVVILPLWLDAEGIRALVESSYLSGRLILLAHHHRYIVGNPLHSAKSFRTGAHSQLLVLQNGDDYGHCDSNILADISRAFKE